MSDAPISTAVINLQDVSVMRGARTTVKRLSLQVRAGSVYALLGGNGAGKTTTLNVLLGFVAPQSGRVRVAGVEPQTDSTRLREVLAYLPENVALYPYLDGIENLQYFCRVGGLTLTAAHAGELLFQAGLAQAAHRLRVAQYSKGMRQKVGLAIAQSRKVQALLLDEPTSGLDPGAANALARRIRQSADDGLAVLMATHDLFNARQVADRIGILRDGVLVAEFDAADLDHAELEAAYLTHAVAPLDDAA